MLYVIVLNVIFGICYYVTLLSVSTVYCLLRRCCWPSPKNFAALKQFGVCDNKLFDFDFDFEEGTEFRKWKVSGSLASGDLCIPTAKTTYNCNLQSKTYFQRWYK